MKITDLFQGVAGFARVRRWLILCALVIAGVTWPAQIHAQTVGISPRTTVTEEGNKNITFRIRISPLPSSAGTVSVSWRTADVPG